MTTSLAAATPQPMLSVTSVSKRFGGVRALGNVDLDISRAELIGVIGPNGSGKTTLFNVIAGALKPDSGTVTWQGRRIDGRPTHRVTAMGIARSFQQALVFGSLSVVQNVDLAREAARRRRQSTPRFASSSDLLEFMGMAATANRLPSELAFGLLRRLGIAIALATDPDLLLLDEPAAGLNGAECVDLARVLRDIRSRGIAICLVDHNMGLVMPLVERVVVLDSGVKIAEGEPGVIREDPQVQQVYFGSARRAH